MTLPAHSRLGPYEILGSLGSGGMGDVYRARDSRLAREVALKVLPPAVTRDPGRLERFDREARAIAALNHPHIVTIYSTEEADGVRFLTMELVEGQTLTELIVGGGLGIARFLEIAVPLADALTAAHNKQITHRDLKPGNVMVSQDGRVKVLDFGLARVGGTETPEHSLAATQAPVTQQGMIVGTMPYMSPEQVEGRTLDPRSDVFSLGVIFYELLSGRRPFQGESSPALMSAILRDTPESLGTIRADVPDALARLVARCLEKRPEDRVQTARDVFNELRHVQKQLESSTVRRASSASGIAASALESLSIAVLPFAVRGSDADAEAIATGLTDDITASLSKFYGLSVVAPQSARAYKDSPLDIRQIAERLDARYVIGGGVRKSGAAVRVTAQLIDAHRGANLWSETYDRRLTDSDVFAVQDDVTDHIVPAVGDRSGVLARSLVQSVRHGPPLHLATARELVLRSWGFTHRPNSPEHAELRAALESRLRVEPQNPHLWAELAHMYVVEHALWFNPLPDPLQRAQRAARRAIELDPAHQSGWETLAITYFHLHDKHGLQEAADRAVRINPRNAHTMAWMGAILAKAGEYDRGCRLIERVMQINPGHPGWVHFTVFDRHFARGEFVESLGAARRVNIPDFMWTHVAIAAAAGHLGLQEDGRTAFEAMTQLAPFVADGTNLREFVTRWYWEPAMIESLIVGVAVSGSFSTAGSTSTDHAVGAASRPPASSDLPAGARGIEGLWIAVLPLSARSGDDESAALADGLTDDITTGLSRFGNLRVLSRPAAERLARGPAGVRTTGQQPQARYVLDGSVRRAGAFVRVSVRLADAHTGTNLWADNYDRDAGRGTFALQDDIASRIVATVGDQTGVLATAMAAALADTPLEQLTVADLTVCYYAYTAHLRAAEHARLRAALERALEREPKAGEGWACLAMLYGQEHSLNLNPQPESQARVRRAAERAVELDPKSQQAWTALARAHLFARDLQALRGAVDRAVSINPLNADMIAHCAIFLSGAGDTDQAVDLVRRAAALKPHHQGWYHFPAFNAHYLGGHDEDALREAKLINMPLVPLASLAALAAAGQLGRATEARTAADALKRVAPELLEPGRARHAWSLWLWSEPMLNRLVDGLQKALALVAGPADARATSSAPDSGLGASAAFTVTVLPFHAPSTGDVATLAEGLVQGLVVGFSRFHYLRVIRRSAATDAVTSGYLLQGTVREARGIVRVMVQLTDGQSGASVWAETYDRPMTGSSIFDLQDDLAATIVATIADAHGALARSMSALVRNKPIDALTPYEAVLRRLAYGTVLSPSEHAEVLAALEVAVERAPNYAAAWASLALICADGHGQGFPQQAGALDRARAAAYKALEIESSCQPAYVALAMIAFFNREPSAFKAAADKAIALNPLDTFTLSMLGSLTAFGGEWEAGLALSQRAISLNPHHPGVYWLSTVIDHYRRRDYVGAFEILNRVNMPSYPHTLILRATICGQLGRLEEGRAVVRQAESMLPGIADRHEKTRRKWFSQELADHIQEGLDKLK